MLKRCEECGNYYSSLADVCPKCGCPNSHMIKQGVLEASQDYEEYKLTLSIIGFVVAVVITYFMRKFELGSFSICLLMGTCIGGVVALFGQKVFKSIIMFVVFVLFMNWLCDLLHLPVAVADGTFYIAFAVLGYAVYIRPFVNIYRYVKYQKDIDKVHTDDVINSNNYYEKQEEKAAMGIRDEDVVEGEYHEHQ